VVGEVVLWQEKETSKNAERLFHQVFDACSQYRIATLLISVHARVVEMRAIFV